MIETVYDIFENLEKGITENLDDIDSIRKLILTARKAVICVTAANPLNTTYIMQTITPINYTYDENPMCPNK